MAQNTDSVSGSSNEIRANIERTRAEMDDTFDALDQKLTPSQLLTEAWRYTKGGSSAGATKVWELAREHPLPATMIGVGIGWLLVERVRGTGTTDFTGSGGRRYGYTGQGASGYGRYAEDFDYDRSGYDEDLSGPLSAVKDAAGNAVDTVKDAASSAREKVGELTDTVKGKASDLSDKASELTDQAKEKAAQLTGKAKQQTRRAKSGFLQMLEENPLAVGAAILTVGAIVGFSIPSTDKEDELLGEKRDQFLDTVKETGQEVLEKGKHIAEHALDTVKHEAEAQGLTADTLADKVKAVGREAKNAVADEAKKQNLTPESLGNLGDQGAKAQENKPADKNAGAQNAGAPPKTAARSGNQPAQGNQGQGNQANKPVEQHEPELARK